MIPKWEDRPMVVANLLNPAFCGEVLRIGIKAYTKETNQGLPFSLTFLFLPILLHKETRERFPKSVSTNFYEWLEENAIVKIFIGTRIKNLVPYTREGMQFLIYYEAIKINNQAELELISYRKKKVLYKNSNEIEDIYKKAEMLGKWLGKTGNIKTIYSLIGIKP